MYYTHPITATPIHVIHIRSLVWLLCSGTAKQNTIRHMTVKPMLLVNARLESSSIRSAYWCLHVNVGEFQTYKRRHQAQTHIRQGYIPQCKSNYPQYMLWTNTFLPTGTNPLQGLWVDGVLNPKTVSMLTWTPVGDEWTDCFTIHGISLPLASYLGFSAMTGEVHDAHE